MVGTQEAGNLVSPRHWRTWGRKGMSPYWQGSGSFVKFDECLMNYKAPFSNNMGNMVLRIEYKLFNADPGGRQLSRQSPGDLGGL